jgi:uncharacterized protein (TIGR02246 family)
MIDDDRMRAVADGYTSAWNSGSAEAVAEFYAPDGRIVINRGEPWEGRAGVARMVAGFYADVPDLRLVCDGLRVAGDHVVYLWTFTGSHSGSGRPLRVVGWEEWEVDADLRVKSSRGWYDADDYARQATGG